MATIVNAIAAGVNAAALVFNLMTHVHPGYVAINVGCLVVSLCLVAFTTVRGI